MPFRAILGAAAEPGSSVPNQNNIVDYVLMAFQEHMDTVKKEIASQYGSIACDGWKDRVKRSVEGYSYQYIKATDESWTYVRCCVLQTPISRCNCLALQAAVHRN